MSVKAMLGFLFFLLFLAGLALVFLKGQHLPATANLNTALTDQRWQPRFLGAEELPATTPLFVEFAMDGSIRGHGGCNNFGGQLESQSGQLRVGPLRITRKACSPDVMTRETAFVGAVKDAIHFDVTSDRLLLLDADRQLMLELAAVNKENANENVNDNNKEG